MAGGTSFYFAYAINQLPKDITFSLVTAMDPTETEPVDRMRKAGINVMLNASRNTVFLKTATSARTRTSANSGYSPRPTPSPSRSSRT